AAALSSGKHLMLVGAPGTGKTELAYALSRAAQTEGYCSGALVATASADWTTFGDESKGAPDLLLETPSGWVIVDHKSFRGGEATWRKRALECAPQLAAYRQVLLLHGVTPVVACLIHFTIAGGVVELAFA